jgi:chromosome partitioning protein
MRLRRRERNSTADPAGNDPAAGGPGVATVPPPADLDSAPPPVSGNGPDIPAAPPAAPTPAPTAPAATAAVSTGPLPPAETGNPPVRAEAPRTDGPGFGRVETDPAPPAASAPAPDPPPQPEPDPEPEPEPEPERAPAARAEPAPEPAVEPQSESVPAPAVEGAAAPRRPRAKASARPKKAPSGPRTLPRVMAVANQKGGVGKTTTTVNLGAALAEMDYRVLVIDLDPQGNATTGLGIDARNFELSMYDVIMRDAPLEDCIEPTNVKNLFVAPATIDLAGVEIELVPAFSRELKLKKAIDAVVDDFDFVLIDCPPSLGLITVNGLAAASEVLVPIQCEYYALEGLSQLLRNVQLVATNLNSVLEVSTIVLTMYDARTRLAIDVAGEVREHFADKVCDSVIPRTVRLSEAPSFGQPITTFDPTSRGAVAYRELAKEVSGGAPKRAG